MFRTCIAGSGIAVLLVMATTLPISAEEFPMQKDGYWESMITVWRGDVVIKATCHGTGAR